MANPFSDPFTNPDIEPSAFSQADFGLPPATPRRPFAVTPEAEPTELTSLDLSAYGLAPRAEDDLSLLSSLDEDSEGSIGSVESAQTLAPFRSSYDGTDLLSEPMDAKRGPTAFQRKEINWADGGEDLSRPRLQSPSPADWLEVDYTFGKKEGATDAPVEAANVFGRQFTRDELMQTENGRELLDLMQLRRSGKVNEGGAIPNFAKGFADWGVADIPFYGWFADIGATVGDAIKMSKTVRKLQDGEKVSNDEVLKLRGYMLRQELEGQRTMAYNVGSTVRSSVTLGAEILASSAAGAAIGAMFGGVGAPVGAAIGAVLTPLKWAFGIGGTAAKAGARKVVNVGMKKVAEKAAKDLTAAELRQAVRTGSEVFGRDGVRSFLQESVKKGIKGKELYRSLAEELQYAKKLADPSRMATRALFSADYRLGLEEGLKLAIEKKALSRATTNLPKEALEKLTVGQRRKLVNEGIRTMMQDGSWKPFVREFSKGVVEGDKFKRTGLQMVREGVADVTGRKFVSPQYAQRMLDIVSETVARDAELAAGKAAFLNPVRFARYVGEHLSRGLVQSEHALFGGAPNIAHKGFSTFETGMDAFKEGFGRVFIEAPVRGSLQFLAGPIATSPLIAMASGEDWSDLRVKGQLGTEVDALIRGDRDKMDAARACALGSAFVEYISEAAGSGLAPMVGGAAAKVLRKSPKAINQGMRNISAAVDRKAGATLDRAIKAVFGDGNLMQGGVEGFAMQSDLALRKLTGRSAVRASLVRAAQNRTIDGFDDATKRALAKKGIDSWDKFARFVSDSAAEGQRLRGAVNFFGYKLFERGMSPDKIVQFFRQAGYGGIIEEMGEERVGDFMRGLFGFDDTASDATLKDKLASMFSGFTDPEQLATELIAFAIPGAIRRSAIASQRWLASGAVGKARMATQSLNYMTNIGRGRVSATVPVNSREEAERLAQFPEESRRRRDAALGTTEANRERIGANAANAYASVQSGALRDGIVAAGGLSTEGVVAEEAREYEGRLAQVLGATSEGHMKSAMNELADFYVGLSDEASLETAMEQTGAEAIFGADGVDAIRREWRKGQGHSFAGTATPGAAIESSLAEWKEFEANPPTVSRTDVDSTEAAVENICAQVEGLRPNASVTSEEEERAAGATDALVADENARDVAVEDGVTLARYLGHAAFSTEAKTSFGRRALSRLIGLVAAASTGDLSLAAASPAAWLANDAGLDKNLQMALLKCYSNGIMAGWAKKLQERGENLRDLVGNVQTAEELRTKLAELRESGQVSAGLLQELEALGEDTFRKQVKDFMSAYITASGVALVTRQDSVDMARSIVAKRHERMGERFERTDDWFAQEAIAEEVENARVDVVNGVIRTMRDSVGYTTHAGQGDYGTYMTVDVVRALRGGTSAEILAAILDSPAFRGVSRIGNISYLSEFDREAANSLLNADEADLAAISRIRTEGEMRADGTYADRELTERELAEVNAVLRANPAEFTPEAFQNEARTFVRRVRLARENSRSTFRKMNDEGDVVTVRVVPSRGGFDLVETVEGSETAKRSHMGGTREGVESYLATQGFAMDEQKLVISQLRNFASADATSLIFMRNGQDREAVRELFRDESGLIRDENQLPPFCRKERRDVNGALEWKYSENDAEAAAAQMRKEFALAEEYDRNRESWRYYLAGTKATREEREARMAEAKRMFLRVYGALQGEGPVGGYETRARNMAEALGIRRSSSMGTSLQQTGLPADAYVMSVDAISADNVVVLAPDYFTLGHGEALLRNGIRLALNSYVAGDSEEALSRNRLLVEAYREFRECADALIAEAAAGSGGKKEADRLRRAFDQLVPVRETGPNTYDLAKMASSSLFFSCDRGNYEEGNGFLHSVELSRVADRFRAKDVFPFFLSAVDEALGGRGLFTADAATLDGLVRYLPAFAPDFAKLAKARGSAAFGGASGETKLPFVCSYRLREGLTADIVRSGEGAWLERDPGVGTKDNATGDYRVNGFDGKVAGYWNVLARSGQTLARAYGDLSGDRSGVLTSAQAFEMARRSDFCGGETRPVAPAVQSDEATGTENRARMSDVVRKVARKEAMKPSGLEDNFDITPAAVECAGNAIRGVFANLANLPFGEKGQRRVDKLLRENKDMTRREAERQVRAEETRDAVNELKGWLTSRGVSPSVITSVIAAYNSAVLHPVRRKTDEQVQNDVADRTNDENESRDDESTNDVDHSRRTAMATTDQNAIAIAGFLKHVMPSEKGDSAPTFARLRADLSRDEMYENVPKGWEEDIAAFKSLLATGSDLLHYGQSLAKVKSALGHREEVDRMLDRVSAVLWKGGHREYALAVSAIRNVDRGERETLLAILSQATSTTPGYFERTSPDGGFSVRFVGGYAKSDLIPRVVAAGYTTLADTALKGMFTATGRRTIAWAAARALEGAVSQIVNGNVPSKSLMALLSPTSQKVPAFAPDPAGVKPFSKDSNSYALVIDPTSTSTTKLTISKKLYETLRSVVTGPKPSPREYAKAVMNLSAIVRHRMNNAAKVMDGLLGVGNQYSAMLRSPYALDVLSREAYLAYDNPSADARANAVNDLVSIANWLVADGKATAKNSWKIAPQARSGIVEDLYVEPIFGLALRLGVDPGMGNKDEQMDVAIEAALESKEGGKKDANWLRDTLRQMARDKVRFNANLDLGTNPAEAYENLQNVKRLGKKFEAGQKRSPGNLATFVNAYLAGMPRSSASLGGKSANAADAASLKTPQTLPSQVPAFVRFVNSPLAKVAKVSDTLSANGWRWSDGSNPVVSFVGAKDTQSRLLDKRYLGGIADKAAVADFTSATSPKSHVIVPLFRADKPSCYAIRVPRGAAEAMVRKGAEDEEVMRPFGGKNSAFGEKIRKVADALAKGEAYDAKEFYDAVSALVSSAVGQSQIDPKRVAVLSSVGPVISTYLDEGDRTDPRAGCYFVSNVYGSTGASMMGGYLTAGVLAERVSGYGGGAWSQAQKLHMFSIMRGVNFKKGQASAVGLGFYDDGRSDDRKSRGEVVSNGALRYAQAQGRRTLERILKEDLAAAGVTSVEGSLDPVPPLKDGATAEETAKHEAAVRNHDKAVDVANAFLRKATVAVDDLETNKAGLFGSSCGIEVPEGATSVSIGGVEIAHVEDGEWKSSVVGFDFDFDGEGIKKGKLLIAPALSALALATGKEVDAATVSAKWSRPDGSTFEGTLADSGLLGEGETLRFEPDVKGGGARMTFFTREIYAQVVANNANSSKATRDHVFPTNATRDHWMIEELVNAISGGEPTRRFVDATTGYSLLQLANLRRNPAIFSRELSRDPDLAALYAAHPDDPSVRDAVTNRFKAFLRKQVIAGWCGTHGVMVPSGGKLVKGDEFAHTARIEWAPGTTAYDRDCYKPAKPYATDAAEALGQSRSWASGAVNADLDGFRYGLYFDEAALDKLLAEVDVPPETAARLFGRGFDEHVARMAKLAEYLKDLKGWRTTEAQRAKYDALMECAYDYTGRKASENSRKPVRFDDLFFTSRDGEERFDFAAFDFEGRVSRHDGQKHLYLGGSVFHAHRSPSGNIAAASGTVRASCPVSFFPDGGIGRESKYALDPVTTATQGSDTDGDSASLQFYDYSAEDLVDEKAMRRFTDAVAMQGLDAFEVARDMGWTETVDGLEVISPKVLSAIERLLFVAQTNNYREAPTIHQGYGTATGVESHETMSGGEIAEHYRDNPPGDGMEFCDYGFVMRHPVGTDAVFAEPFTAETLERFNRMLSDEARKALGEEFATEQFALGKKMNKVFEAAVDKLTGKPAMNLLDHESVAETADAASDSVGTRGIAVANQTAAGRIFAIRFGAGAEKVMTWDKTTQRSELADLVAHMDGVSNNLFDTLKKMFATRADWTTDLLPMFLNGVVRSAGGAKRCDSAFFLAEAVNFIVEANREGSVLNTYAKLHDPRVRDAVARRLLSEYGERTSASATADSVIARFASLKENEEVTKRMSKDEKTLFAAAHMRKKSGVTKAVADEYKRRSADLSLSLENRDYISALDHMKIVGANVRRAVRRAARPATQPDTAVEFNVAAFLQERVVRQFSELLAQFADSTELLEYAVDGQIGRKPSGYQRGTALATNYGRFVHLVGAVRSADRDTLFKVASARGADGKVTPSTERLLRRIAATARRYSEQAAVERASDADTPAKVALRRFFSALAVSNAGVEISLYSRADSREMEAIRAGFDVLVGSTEMFEIYDEGAQGFSVPAKIQVRGHDLAYLLIVHASLLKSFSGTVDYVTQSNLPAAFDDWRLRRLESVRPEILADAGLASALGAADIRVGRDSAFDLFGTVTTSSVVGTTAEARIELEFRVSPRLREIGGRLRELKAERKTLILESSKKSGTDLQDMVELAGRRSAIDKEIKSLEKMQRDLTVYATRLQETDVIGEGATRREFPTAEILRKARAYDIFTTREAPATPNKREARERTRRDRFSDAVILWDSPNYDPVKEIFSNALRTDSVDVGDVAGFSVEAASQRSGAALVSPSWADPLTTCTEFRRPGETDAAAVFVQPVVNADGRTTNRIKALATSLEGAVNGYLSDVADACEADESKRAAREAFLDLNPTRKFLTYDARRVTRDIAGILEMSVRRDPSLFDAVDGLGDRLARHPDKRIADAFNAVNAKIGDSIERPESEPATRASFMGGASVDTSSRAEFIVRAEGLRPGFTEQQSRSVKEAVKGAFESAFDDATVEEVRAADGSETNLLKVTRKILDGRGGTRSIVTYVSYGSQLGDTLGVEAAADSIAELLNARAGEGAEKVTGESLIRRLGKKGVTRLSEIMRRTGGMVGESVVGGFDFAPAMSGLIRLSEHANFTTLFHEYYHQMIAVYKKLGILDKATEDDLNAKLGGEERAAEAFGRYLSGVENGADDVELRDFLKDDGVTAEHLATFERFRTYAFHFARAAFRGIDPNGAPVFVAVKVMRGDLTAEEAAKIAAPSEEDVRNVENELVGRESRERLDLLTDEQMTRALDTQERVLSLLGEGKDRAAKDALRRFERSLAPVGRVETRVSPTGDAVEEAGRLASDIANARRDADALSTVSYFIRRAMGRYAKDGKIPGFEEQLRKYREFPVTGDAATGPDAALFYTVRSFIAHVAEAEGVAIYKENGELNDVGEALMSNGAIGELAMRFVYCAEADRERNSSDRDRAEHASSAWAFSRALQHVAPGAYTRHCRRLAERSADAFRRLAEAILARQDKTQEDIDAANEFLARSQEVGRFVDFIARGQSIQSLLPSDIQDGKGNLHGLFMVYFAGSAMFQRMKADGKEEYLYPKGPVRPYSRSLPHTNALGTADASLDPLVDLAYNYAAQAFSVAEAARNYRRQVLGEGKDNANPEAEEDLAGAGLGEANPSETVLSGEEVRALDRTLQDTLGVSVEPSGELAAQLDAEAQPLDVNASAPVVDPAQFYSRVDTTTKPVEWILADPGTWLAADMQKNLSGVPLRAMMTDHSIRAVTESKYRLAMDWLQFFGLDTHVGDPVRALDFVESQLGKNADGDYAMSEDNAHTVMRFSKTRGFGFGIFNWQEKRVGEPITQEDWRNIHDVGRLVRLIASRSSYDLTGIDVGFLATPLDLAHLAADDYAQYYSFAALKERMSGEARHALTPVEDMLRRVVDGLSSAVVEDSGERKGLYSSIVEALHRAAVEARRNGYRAEKANDALLSALEKAGLVRSSSHGDRTVVSVSVDRMVRAWEGSEARAKLVAAGRPAQMLNPYYWGSKFGEAVVELNDVASKSSYVSEGEGSRFTLAGTRRFWWHGGTGSHKVQVEAYQNAQRAFEGLKPDGVDVLRATYSEIFDIIEASNDPKALRRKAFSPSGMTTLSDRELRYLAYLMGLTSRDPNEAKFDVRAFARDIARGKYESRNRDMDLPCTISRDATALDVRLAIADLASRDAFKVGVPELPVADRQRYLNAVTAADMLRDALQREVPAKVTALNEAEVFDRTGLLGDSRTAAESLIEMCKELTTAERFRGCLAQMLTSLSADGTPAFIVAPTDAMTEVDRMPDEYWGALARHVVKFLGRKFPTLAYDAGLSGAENMRRIHRQVVESSQNLYGKLSTAKYGGDRMFQGDVLCRLDDRDVAGNVDEVTRLMGGEAANYMKQLLSTLRAPTQNAAWRIFDAVTSWSKISSVGFSAFFQIATAFESPAAASTFLETVAGQAEWIGKAVRKLGGSDGVFTRDVMRLLNSNDAFLTEARELCDLIGMPLDATVDFFNDPNDRNPVLGNLGGIKRDIERVSAFAERAVGARTGKGLRKTLEFLYKHPTDYTFNVVLNGVKLAVVMQTVRRLRQECLRGGRPLDIVKELRKYAPYLDAEIGGIDPGRYAWATPGMRRVLCRAMFSWQWTVGAWVAGGGEAVSDLIFGGHSTNQATRRHAMLRWLRMFGIVKFGVPAVMQAAIKALSMLGLRALPPDPDDPEDKLAEEIDEMPWWTFNNESKAGMLAFDVTPILKLAARVPGMKELKGANIPVISWAIPAYVGGGRNTTGHRRYYMHFGKQSDEFWRWFDDPVSQFISKLSIPVQKGAEGILGSISPNGIRKSFADKTLFDRFFTLSLNPDESATANLFWALVSSFSLESMQANADAGVIAAIGPMRMGQSLRSSRLRIAERLAKIVEDDRTGNPWTYSKNRRKFNLLCTDILREAQLNGVPVSDLAREAIASAAAREYKKFFEAFPRRLDGPPDVRKMQDAIRALTRLDRKAKDIRSNIVQKFREKVGVDLKANRAYYQAVRDAIRATQTSPIEYSPEVAEERFDQYLVRPDTAIRATNMDERGGDVFGNFLATDDVPDTLFGVPVVRDGYTSEDLEFFKEHPSAGGFYDMGETGEAELAK